mmetsp:Transcript_46340/g.104659  ORF Transcript_46340/g.104659 Transcript_46340/m.104659 type:complete len:88 (+) Transcript_46340:82-345(+)
MTPQRRLMLMGSKKANSSQVLRPDIRARNRIFTEVVVAHDAAEAPVLVGVAQRLNTGHRSSGMSIAIRRAFCQVPCIKVETARRSIE